MSRAKQVWTLQEQCRTGLHSLVAATALLQRIRRAHPTAVLYEAADLHWWWRTARSTDSLPQLFWFDRLGRPQATVIATDWGDGIALAPIVMPDTSAEWIAHVIERGLVHAAELGFEAVDLEVDCADDVMHDVLVGQGFTVEPDDSSASVSVVEAWLSADARPAISALHEDYRLYRRLDRLARPHHMVKRGGPAVEQRLLQTSLYRPDLDLLIVEGNDNLAAYSLFWYDAETATGLVEPMRTEDEHQRRGLARHLLTTGISLLADAGAERIKICFEPDNAASAGLYLSAGFEPVRQTVVFSRQIGALPS